MLSRRRFLQIVSGSLVAAPFVGEAQLPARMYRVGFLSSNAGRATPIVMIGVGDPVGIELVANLARPGGNVTGLSFSAGMETATKGLELLKEALPKVRQIISFAETKTCSMSTSTATS